MVQRKPAKRTLKQPDLLLPDHRVARCGRGLVGHRGAVRIKIRLPAAFANSVDQSIPRDPEQIRSKRAVSNFVATLHAVEERSLNEVFHLVAKAR